jgi:hypothetical protein
MMLLSANYQLVCDGRYQSSYVPWIKVVFDKFIVYIYIRMNLQEIHPCHLFAYIMPNKSKERNNSNSIRIPTTNYVLCAMMMCHVPAV